MDFEYTPEELQRLKAALEVKPNFTPPRYGYVTKLRYIDSEPTPVQVSFLTNPLVYNMGEVTWQFTPSGWVVWDAKCHRELEG